MRTAVRDMREESERKTGTVRETGEIETTRQRGKDRFSLKEDLFS